MIENITVVTGAVFIVVIFECILWGFKTNINLKKFKKIYVRKGKNQNFIVNIFGVGVLSSTAVQQDM
jgi:hypothetical protein